MGPEAAWFERPGSPRVTLLRRRSARRILARLVERRLAAPGRALSVPELFEAGWGNYLSRYANFAPRVDGSHNDKMISVLELCSGGCPNNNGYPNDPSIPGIANLVYRFNQPLQQGFERHQIGTIAQMRASAS